MCNISMNVKNFQPLQVCDFQISAFKDKSPTGLLFQYLAAEEFTIDHQNKYMSLAPRKHVYSPPMGCMFVAVDLNDCDHLRNSCGNFFDI